MRLCPEDVSDTLSGFGHNGVSPVGLATRLPIILSHRVTRLAPDFFFCGAARGARSCLPQRRAARPPANEPSLAAPAARARPQLGRSARLLLLL